jgi:hypothetical protein
MTGKTQAIQEGFTAGEITPLLHGRVSADIYKESVAYMKNMISIVHGPAIRRPGTRYIADAKYQSAAKHRLMSFAVGNPHGACTIHIGPATMQLYNSNGKVRIPFAAPATDVEFANPWAAEDHDLISYVQLPGTNPSLVVVHPNVAPQQITYTIATDTFAIAPIAFTSSPWGVGNYPSVVWTSSGRLMFASSPTTPERVWLSKVGSANYFFFTAGTNPDDSFSFDMNEAGQVLWLRGATTLVIGALSGVWDLVSLDGGPLGPSNYRARKHDSNAPSINKAYKSDDGISYISHESKRIYFVDPEKTTDVRYQVAEQSFLGRQALESAVRNVTGTKFPHSLMFFTQGTSFVTSMKDKLLEYSSWHRHSISGTVHDVVTTFDRGTFVTFAVITFPRTAGDKVCIVRFDWDYPLDNNKIISQALSATITGLGHLEGQTVYTWANNKSHGGNVVSGGQIIILEKTTDAIVGVA